LPAVLSNLKQLLLVLQEEAVVAAHLVVAGEGLRPQLQLIMPMMNCKNASII